MHVFSLKSPKTQALSDLRSLTYSEKQWSVKLKKPPNRKNNREIGNWCCSFGRADIRLSVHFALCPRDILSVWTSTAGVIWLCTCVRYWPYHGDGTCVSVLISVGYNLF